MTTDAQIAAGPDSGDMTNLPGTRPMSPTARRTGKGLALAASAVRRHHRRGSPRHRRRGQDASEQDGVVEFRVADDVVQVHVLSPDHKRDSVQIASAAAARVAGAPRLS